jgi:hypothetical protein
VRRGDQRSYTTVVLWAIFVEQETPSPSILLNLSKKSVKSWTTFDHIVEWSLILVTNGKKNSILEQLTGETSDLSRHEHLENAKKRNQLNDEIRKLRIDLQHAQHHKKSKLSCLFRIRGYESSTNELFPTNLYLRVDWSTWVVATQRYFPCLLAAWCPRNIRRRCEALEL